jgi:hypothetical protein
MASDFFVSLLAFFPFLTDRLDLARVNLALWTCSVVGEEPLTIVAREEGSDDVHDEKQIC